MRMAAVFVMHVARLAMRRVGMGVIVMRVVVVMRVVMAMIVVMMPMIMMMRMRGRGSADALRRAQQRPFGEEAPALGVEKLRAHQRDQRIARDLDPPHRGAHRLRGRAEQRRRDADHGDRDQRLHQRGGKREHDAALPGLLVGDQVGRDHRLAVTRPRGVENSVREGEPHQQPCGAAVGLGVADRARQQPVELGLLGEQPAGDARRRRRRRRRALRRSEWILRERVGRADDESHADQREDDQVCLAPPGQGRHGHFTAILLANCAP